VALNKTYQINDSSACPFQPAHRFHPDRQRREYANRPEIKRRSTVARRLRLRDPRRTYRTIAPFLLWAPRASAEQAVGCAED
jgi:hypothetical protein